LERLIEYRVDGIICVAYDWKSATMMNWLDEVLAKDIPIAIVDDRTNAEKIDSIVTDDFNGSKAAVQHLIDQGHRRIAHVAGGYWQTAAQDRLDGYKSALDDAGIAFDDSIVLGKNFDPDLAIDVIDRMLSLPNSVTAAFAASDVLAATFIGGMAHCGLRCPQDIAVVGYGDTSVAHALSLTSVAQNPLNIGKRACDQILKRINDTTVQPTLITLPTEIVYRRSTERKS
jgi:LacI family transcriptional regulator